MTASATLTIKSRPLAGGRVSWFLWIRRPRPAKDELIPVKQYQWPEDRPLVEKFAEPYRIALRKGQLKAKVESKRGAVYPAGGTAPRCWPSGRIRWRGKVTWPDGHRQDVEVLEEYCDSKEHATEYVKAVQEQLSGEIGISALAEPEPQPELADPIDPPEQPGVYFVLQGEFIKIGVASNIRKRLKSAGTFAPCEMKLLAWQRGGRKEEQDLHAQFHSLRARGEWFRFEGELRRYVASLPRIAA